MLTFGTAFEREIREQPDVWVAIAQSEKAGRLAEAIRDRDVVLVGSGSSLFMCQLGALALRRLGIRAHALAATEARIDHLAYLNAAVIACSQSGRSSDLLDALDVLQPRRLIALTNTPDSPLGIRADICIDAGSGCEIAVPASKSVTSTAAILLWTAALLSGGHAHSAGLLIETAAAVQWWLRSPQVESVREAAQRIALRQSVIVASTGYGLPVARECALKVKEASYIHAEGFAAGEFRHGSAAMLDAGCTLIGIADESSVEIVERVLEEASETKSLRFTIGTRVAGVQRLGPDVDGVFNALAWLVTSQLIGLYAGRARGVESDTPRRLTKALL